MKREPNQNIVNYVWNYLNQGYSLSSIRKSLHDQGFSEEEVNFAIDFLYANHYYQGSENYSKPEKKIKEGGSAHHMKVNHIAFISLFILGIIIVGATAIFILTNTSQEIPTDRKTEQVLYEEITVPEEREVQEQKPPALSEPGKKIEETRTDTSSETLSRRQIDLRVEFFSEDNPREATRYCKMHELEEDISFCIRSVAVSSGISSFCGEVKTDYVRDGCYFDMVFQHDDFASCQFIKNENIKKNCEEVQRLNQQFSEFDIEETDYYEEDIDWDLIAQQYAIPANFY